jgi:hypothetical protein
MKVLSVRQPYASLLVRGIKRFESRTWSTDYRGPLLIHASSTQVSKDAIAYIENDRQFFDAVVAQGWTTYTAIRGLRRRIRAGSFISGGRSFARASSSAAFSTMKPQSLIWGVI